MDRLVLLESTALPFPVDNVDTDVITPIRRILEGLPSMVEHAFEPLRFAADGSLNPACALNDPRWKDAAILLAGRNFGCGSSRETAVWAVRGMGFRCVIAPSFGDIFRNNCYQNGLLPVALPENIVRQLLDRAENEPGYRLTIDLDHQTVADERDTLASFDIDPSVKHRLLNGLDDIGLTLQHVSDISAFETRRPGYLPRTVA